MPELVPLQEGGSRHYSDSPEPDGENYGADDLGITFPPFQMPYRRWTPRPILMSGSILEGVAQLDRSAWMVITPSWRAAPQGASEYSCPPDGLCAPHGPRCSGEGNSGQIHSISFTGVSIPRQSTSPYTPEPITEGPDGFELQYRTLNPYVPGTLTLSYQGITLVKGVDYFETDPSAGIFTLSNFQAREEGQQLYVEYRGYGPGTEPGEPAPLPGEPGYTEPLPPPTAGPVYRPANQRQGGWGTIYDSTNCNMACSAMALDRHTLGRHTRYVGIPQSTPPSHRYYSGNTSLNGTGHDDAKRAWNNGWHQTLTTPGTVSWSYLVTQIQGGRGATVFGRYAYMAEPYKKSRTFDGPHAIYINEQLADGSFWGYDPIVGYPIVYPYNVLRTYADSYHGFRDRMSISLTRVTALMP